MEGSADDWVSFQKALFYQLIWIRGDFTESESISNLNLVSSTLALALILSNFKLLSSAVIFFFVCVFTAG